MPTTLADYWPGEENCRECLVVEAEAAPDAVVLAVHQPMRLMRKFHGVANRPEEAKSEADVLEAFLIKHPASGTLVLPLTGASGAGKSHLIRWLDANLKLRPDHATRHVVRVPKSASLRGVLELILRDLPNKYDGLRQELKTARLTPDLLQATRQIQAHLLTQIELAGNAAQARLKAGEGKPNDRARAAHCSRTYLIALLLDPAIADHFTAWDNESKGVLARFAERFLQGSHDHNEGPSNQFRKADFDFVTQESGKDWSKMASDYLKLLKIPKSFAEAIEFLNEVTETALAQYFNDLGGPSLAELFVTLRRLLLEDRLELVLLIEDFAVMAGIKDQLIQVMTTPDIVDEQKLCVMRTALAVTEGMLPETVKTRAQTEWRIESRPFATDEEAVDKFCDFIGGYLNAARCGTAKLQNAFVQLSESNNREGDWVPSFHDEHGENLGDADSARLRAFGTCQHRGHPLFPFNRGMVEQLAIRYLREGPVFRFDPRLLINRLLRATLIDYRASFVSGEFPTKDFDGFEGRFLKPAVSTEIRSRCGGQAERASALLYYWGGNPQTPGEAARLPQGIVEAFGLPQINWSVAPEPPSEPVKEVHDPIKGPPLIKPKVPPNKWEGLLDDWRKGGTLPQSDAAALREKLATAIKEWLDWDGMLMKSRLLLGEGIYLPNVKNNPSEEKAMAVLALEADLKDTAKSNLLFTALEAVIRHDGGKTWDYEGGEKDAAVYANLIEGLVRQTEAWLRKQGAEMRPQLIKPVAQTLLIDARTLNLEGSTSNADVDNLHAMLAMALPADGMPAATDLWSRFKNASRTERASLRESLLKQISARQGGGEPQAVDAAPLLEAIKELRQSWKMNTLDALQTSDPTSVKEALRRVRDKLEPAVAERRSKVETWQKTVVDAFGDAFNLDALKDDLRQTALAANQNGLFRWREGENKYDTLRDSIRDVGPLNETLNEATRACQHDAAFGVMLSALAKLDDGTMDRTEKLITSYSRFLKETGAEVTERLRDAPPSLEDEAARVATVLGDLGNAWAGIEKEVAA